MDQELEPHFLLPLFGWAHLSTDQQEVSKPFAELADVVAYRTAQRLPPQGAVLEASELTPAVVADQTTVALRALLVAKDAAVRAVLVQ